MDTEQPAPDAPCGICDHPHQGHGTRYTAGHGDHEWTEPKGVPFRPHTAAEDERAAAEATRTETERARDWPAPRIVPHPDGGVTMTSQPEPTTAHQGIIRRILNATRSTT